MSDGKSPLLCSVCKKDGKRSKLLTYQINFDEAIILCENRECTYPIDCQTPKSIIVKRKYTDVKNKRQKVLSLPWDSLPNSPKSNSSDESFPLENTNSYSRKKMQPTRTVAMNLLTSAAPPISSTSGQQVTAGGRLQSHVPRQQILHVQTSAGLVEVDCQELVRSAAGVQNLPQLAIVNQTASNVQASQNLVRRPLPATVSSSVMQSVASSGRYVQIQTGNDHKQSVVQQGRVLPTANSQMVTQASRDSLTPVNMQSQTLVSCVSNTAVAQQELAMPSHASNVSVIPQQQTNASQGSDNSVVSHSRQQTIQPDIMVIPQQQTIVSQASDVSVIPQQTTQPDVTVLSQQRTIVLQANGKGLVPSPQNVSQANLTVVQQRQTIQPSISAQPQRIVSQGTYVPRQQTVTSPALNSSLISLPLTTPPRAGNLRIAPGQQIINLLPQASHVPVTLHQQGPRLQSPGQVQTLRLTPKQYSALMLKRGVMQNKTGQQGGTQRWSVEQEIAPTIPKPAAVSSPQTRHFDPNALRQQIQLRQQPTTTPVASMEGASATGLTAEISKGQYLEIPIEEAGNIPGVTPELLATLHRKSQQTNKIPRLLIPYDQLKMLNPGTHALQVGNASQSHVVMAPQKTITMSPRTHQVQLKPNTPNITVKSQQGHGTPQKVGQPQKAVVSVEPKVKQTPSPTVITISSPEIKTTNINTLQAKFSALNHPGNVTAPTTPMTVAKTASRSQNVLTVTRASESAAPSSTAPQLVFTDVECTPGDRYIQWRNEDALCWLDVILTLLVFNKTIRSPFVMDKMSESASCVIKTICAAYDQALHIIRSPPGSEDGSLTRPGGQVGCIKGMVGTGGGGVEVSTPSSLGSQEGGVLFEKFFESIDTDKTKCKIKSKEASASIDQSVPENTKTLPSNNIDNPPLEPSGESQSLSVSAASPMDTNQRSSEHLSLQSSDNVSSQEEMSNKKTDAEIGPQSTSAIMSDTGDSCKPQSCSSEAKSNESKALLGDKEDVTSVTASDETDNIKKVASSSSEADVQKCDLSELKNDSVEMKDCVQIPMDVSETFQNKSDVQSETVSAGLSGDTNLLCSDQSAEEDSKLDIVTISEDSCEKTDAESNKDESPVLSGSDNAQKETPQSDVESEVASISTTVSESLQSSAPTGATQAQTASKEPSPQTTSKEQSARFFVPVVASTDPNQQVRHIKFSRPLSADLKKILALPPEDRQAMVKDLSKEDKDELIHYYIQYLFPGLEIEQYFSARDVVNHAREEMWTYLEPRLKCEKGKNDSPMIALYMVLSSIKPLKANFLVNATWIMNCQICEKKKVERQSKTLITFPNVGPDWTMHDAYFLRSCSFCGAPKQKRNMVVTDFPPSVALHFMEGLPSTDLETYDFVHGRYRYQVTGCIQYRKFPDHFITWLRDPKTNTWMECDDLKLPVCQYTKCKPTMQPSEVHIVVWERQDFGNEDPALESSQRSDAQGNIADPDAEISMDSTASSSISTSKSSLISTPSLALPVVTTAEIISKLPSSAPSKCYTIAPPPTQPMTQVVLKTPEKATIMQAVPTSPDVTITGVSSTPDVAITHVSSPPYRVDPPSSEVSITHVSKPTVGVRRKSADSSNSSVSIKVARLSESQNVASSPQQWAFQTVKSTSSSSGSLSETSIDMSGAMAKLTIAEKREFMEMMRQLQEMVSKYKILQQRVVASGDPTAMQNMMAQLQQTILNILKRMPPVIGQKFFKLYQQNGYISRNLIMPLKLSSQASAATSTSSPSASQAGEITASQAADLIAALRRQPVGSLQQGIKPILIPSGAASSLSQGLTPLLRGQLAETPTAPPRPEKSYLKLVQPLLEKFLPALSKEQTKGLYAGYVPLSKRDHDSSHMPEPSSATAPTPASTVITTMHLPASSTAVKVTARKGKGIQQRQNPQNVTPPIQRVATSGRQVYVLKNGQKFIAEEVGAFQARSAKPAAQGVPGASVSSPPSITSDTLSGLDISIADLLRNRPIVGTPTVTTTVVKSVNVTPAAKPRAVRKPSTKTVQSTSVVTSPIEASVAANLQNMASSTCGRASAVFNAAATAVLEETVSSTSTLVSQAFPQELSTPTVSVGLTPNPMEVQIDNAGTTSSSTTATSAVTIDSGCLATPVIPRTCPDNVQNFNRNATDSLRVTSTSYSLSEPVVTESEPFSVASTDEGVSALMLLANHSGLAPSARESITMPVTVPSAEREVLPISADLLAAVNETFQTQVPVTTAYLVSSLPSENQSQTPVIEKAVLETARIEPADQSIVTPVTASSEAVVVSNPVISAATPTENLGLGKRVRRKPARFLDDDESDSSSMSGKSPSRSSTGSSPKRGRYSKQKSVERCASAALLDIPRGRGRPRGRGTVERSVSTPVLNLQFDDAAGTPRRGRGRGRGRGQGRGSYSPMVMEAEPRIVEISSAQAQGNQSMLTSVQASTSPPKRPVTLSRKTLECLTPQQLEALQQLQATGMGDAAINLDNIHRAADGSLIIIAPAESQGVGQEVEVPTSGVEPQ